jgi:hypothetical protein
MATSVTLREERDSTGALATFVVSAGWGATIVFTEGTYYPRLDDVESREIDYSVVVAAESLPLLASRLGIEGAQIEEVFSAVVESSRAAGVTSLVAARRMLDRLEVPYDQRTWFSID